MLFNLTLLNLTLLNLTLLNLPLLNLPLLDLSRFNVYRILDAVSMNHDRRMKRLSRLVDRVF